MHLLQPTYLEHLIVMTLKHMQPLAEVAPVMQGDLWGGAVRV